MAWDVVVSHIKVRHRRTAPYRNPAHQRAMPPDVRRRALGEARQHVGRALALALDVKQSPWHDRCPRRPSARGASLARPQLEGIGPARLVLCGHTYMPRLAQLGGVLVVNPGCVGMPACSVSKQTGHSTRRNPDLTTVPLCRYAFLWRAAVRMVTVSSALKPQRRRLLGEANHDQSSPHVAWRSWTSRVVCTGRTGGLTLPRYGGHLV